ncbi:hypothetical protein U1Q18_052577 [Sarracenia purpurea var. burkii]
MIILDYPIQEHEFSLVVCTAEKRAIPLIIVGNCMVILLRDVAVDVVLELATPMLISLSFLLAHLVRLALSLRLS